MPFSNRQAVEDAVHKVCQRLGLVPYLHCFTRKSSITRHKQSRLLRNMLPEALVH